MNRRAYLSRGVSIGALGTLGALAGCLGTGGDDEAGDDVPDGEDEPPFELRALDPETDDPVTVPAADRVWVANFARTDCPTSEGHISTIQAARQELASDGIAEPDVEYVSIFRTVDDPAETDEEFLTWWNETDGDWTLLIDDSRVAFDYYEIDLPPTTVFFSADGETKERIQGSTRTGAIESAVRSALEE